MLYTHSTSRLSMLPFVVIGMTSAPHLSSARNALKNAASALINNASATDREKQDFAYLWAIVQQFLEQLPYQSLNHPNGPFGALPFRTQLAQEFSELALSHVIIHDLITKVSELMDQGGNLTNQGDGDDNNCTHMLTRVRSTIREHALCIQFNLEHYLEAQASLKAYADHDPDGLTGANFITILHTGEDENSPSSLLTRIHSALVTTTEHIVTLHLENLQQNERMQQYLVEIFYADLVRYFSLDSPPLIFVLYEGQERTTKNAVRYLWCMVEKVACYRRECDDIA
ncbi:hypothetical protein T440DRAFT_547033 [Plenodomus tracheiphilus IPT5]|uniref:Uncharacterized protein n=1 Tax=Plenodomus tracheiphilus IPT5 TaxID=1408161 RepID=A0A6A7ARK5_9PLEO|nr:hypothetical protein T440DRAFT_547033 [Plenodomus tracheiphilus IPT5]